MYQKRRIRFWRKTHQQILEELAAATSATCVIRCESLKNARRDGKIISETEMQTRFWTSEPRTKLPVKCQPELVTTLFEKIFLLTRFLLNLWISISHPIGNGNFRCLNYLSSADMTMPKRRRQQQQNYIILTLPI